MVVNTLLTKDNENIRKDEIQKCRQWIIPSLASDNIRTHSRSRKEVLIEKWLIFILKIDW